MKLVVAQCHKIVENRAKHLGDMPWGCLLNEHEIKKQEVFRYAERQSFRLVHVGMHVGNNIDQHHNVTSPARRALVLHPRWWISSLFEQFAYLSWTKTILQSSGLDYCNVLLIASLEIDLEPLWGGKLIYEKIKPHPCSCSNFNPPVLGQQPCTPCPCLAVARSWT